MPRAIGDYLKERNLPQRLRMAHGMLVARASYFRFGVPEGLFDAEELEHGLHGGALETSLMLHIVPDQVRRGEIQNFTPTSRAMAESYDLLAPRGPGAFAWASQDLHPSGACLRHEARPRPGATKSRTRSRPRHK